MKFLLINGSSLFPSIQIATNLLKDSENIPTFTRDPLESGYTPGESFCGAAGAEGRHQPPWWSVSGIAMLMGTKA